MKRMLVPLLLWTLLLGACSTGGLSPDAPPSSLVTDTFTPVVIPAVTTEVLPFEGCAYQWAYQELPQLSSQLQEEIKTLDSGVTARATAFGENCLYADGRVDFLAMETDFYLDVPVADLSDFESFGNWIARSMEVVEGLPRGLIVGPQAGFVEFRFTKSEAEFLYVRVPIQRYRDIAAGKTGEELFRLFYTGP